MDLDHPIITNFGERTNYRNTVVTELNIALNMALIDALKIDRQACCTPTSWATGNAFRLPLDTRIETMFGLDAPDSFMEVFADLSEELADEISLIYAFHDVSPYILVETEEQYNPEHMKYILKFTTSFIITNSEQEET